MGAVGVHVNATNLMAAEADPDVTTKGVVDNTKEELERLRATLTNALATAGGSYVAANFAPIVGHGATATNTPSALDAWDGGHWSPLAAYAPSADAVLVLDVARCASRRASRVVSAVLPSSGGVASSRAGGAGVDGRTARAADTRPERPAPRRERSPDERSPDERDGKTY